tara:strand:- start:479 stop:685 length:207 start_codon:yes stop_codon:yes gene_type:complete
MQEGAVNPTIIKYYSISSAISHFDTRANLKIKIFKHFVYAVRMGENQNDLPLDQAHGFVHGRPSRVHG